MENGKLLLNKGDTVYFLENDAIEFIRQAGFKRGEDKTYIALSKDVARILKKSEIPKESLFEVTSHGSNILLVYENKKLPLFFIFRDRFSMRENIGCCPEYCREHLNIFYGALQVCKELYKQ